VLDYNETPIKFKIYTRAFDAENNEFLPAPLTASVSTDGKQMRLSGTASSTIKDLHGDEITESGLLDMETAANNNLTIFGNHKYEVPEDVFGSVEAAVLARSVAQTKTGDPVHDLRMSIIINEENDRAVKTWKAIRKGTKLGLSIGAMIPEGGAKVDKKTKRLIIEHLELLETSIVAIPANPRSWVDSARKSYFEAPASIEPEAVEALPPVVTQTIGYVPMTTTSANTSNNLLQFTFPQSDDEIVAPTPDPEITDADSCPSCGKGKSATGCDNGYHKDAEPEVVAASVDPETQAAPQSEPPSDDVTNSASETVAQAQEAVVGMDAEVTSAFAMLGDLVERLTAELASIKAAKAAAEQQRDKAMSEAAEAISSTKAIVAKLAELPLGPRAAVVRDAAQSDLSDLEGIYSRDFLEVLRS